MSISERGVRDLDWIISAVEYDFREDNDDVNGSWKIKQSGDYVYVLYQPYDDGSAPVEYPVKATKYRIDLIESVEGENAGLAFEVWTK